MSVSPEPTAEEVEVVAAVLALLGTQAVDNGAAGAAPRSRWADAGRRAARRGVTEAAGWKRPTDDQARALAKTTIGGQRR